MSVHPLRAASSGLVGDRGGAGEPLLLLHGVGESSVGWRPVIDALRRDFDVIVPDLPGFGRSPALPRGVAPTAAAIADAVEHYLDELAVGTCHIAGYSLGGRVALELASRGRARSVVAIAPDGMGTPSERIYETVALMSRRSLATALAPVVGPVPLARAGRTAFFASDRSRPWQLPPADARLLLRDFADSPAYVETVMTGMYDLVGGLGRIDCPVLILQGLSDPLITSQSWRYLAFVPTARLRWLPFLSHVPISDDPDLITRLILDFAGANEPLAA